MLKNLSFYTLVGALALSTACIVTITDDATTNVDSTTGDGDGDPGDGDPGDGDPGDGDPSGDGDGDPTGDGDGDPGTGDGDGDPGDGLCGWYTDEMSMESYYECGGVGSDPGGTNPIECPASLVEGEPCESSEPALTSVGCCDGDIVWYCTGNDTIAMFDCNDA